MLSSKLHAVIIKLSSTAHNQNLQQTLDRLSPYMVADVLVHSLAMSDLLHAHPFMPSQASSVKASRSKCSMRSANWALGKLLLGPFFPRFSLLGTCSRGRTLGCRDGLVVAGSGRVCESVWLHTG